MRRRCARAVAVTRRPLEHALEDGGGAVERGEVVVGELVEALEPGRRPCARARPPAAPRPQPPTETSDERRSAGSAVRSISPASSSRASTRVAVGRWIFSRAASSEGVSGPWHGDRRQRGALGRAQVSAGFLAHAPREPGDAPGAGDGRGLWWRWFASLISLANDLRLPGSRADRADLRPQRLRRARPGEAGTIAAAFRPVYWSSDADHHRAVFTLVGRAGRAAQAVLDGRARGDRARRPHAPRGLHPRVGAVDVAPIVYLDEADSGRRVRRGARAGRRARAARRPRLPLRRARRAGGPAPSCAGPAGCEQLHPDFGPTQPTRRPARRSSPRARR